MCDPSVEAPAGPPNADAGINQHSAFVFAVKTYRAGWGGEAADSPPCVTTHPDIKGGA